MPAAPIPAAAGPAAAHASASRGTPGPCDAAWMRPCAMRGSTERLSDAAIEAAADQLTTIEAWDAKFRLGKFSWLLKGDVPLDDHCCLIPSKPLARFLP